MQLMFHILVFLRVIILTGHIGVFCFMASLITATGEKPAQQIAMAATMVLLLLSRVVIVDQICLIVWVTELFIVIGAGVEQFTRLMLSDM
jgi:hypothetical protein